MPKLYRLEAHENLDVVLQPMEPKVLDFEAMRSAWANCAARWFPQIIVGHREGAISNIPTNICFKLFQTSTRKCPMFLLIYTSF